MLFRVLVKTIKFLNFFKGKKETGALMDAVWRETVKKHRRKGFMMVVKYAIIGLLLAAQATLFYLLKKKKTQLQNSQSEAQVEEAKEDENEISIEDFMFQKSNFGKHFSLLPPI